MSCYPNLFLSHFGTSFLRSCFSNIPCSSFCILHLKNVIIEKYVFAFANFSKSRFSSEFILFLSEVHPYAGLSWYAQSRFSTSLPYICSVITHVSEVTIKLLQVLLQVCAAFLLSSLILLNWTFLLVLCKEGMILSQPGSCINLLFCLF